jgi:zinc transport system substrate-binding protein
MLGYLTSSYGLNQVAIDGLNSEGEPSSETLANIIDYINNNNIKVVFYQEFISPAIALAIANETVASIDVLSTVEALTNEQIEADDDYLSIMAKNLVSLKNALI